MSIQEQANTSAASKIKLLKKRANLLRDARLFFDKRGVLEVDTPCLSRFASVDAHIDLISCTALEKPAFLHSSPEYGMKRLLSLGIGDIYQLSHVFRDGESGHKHNPEFMMCEWYRVGMSFDAMMQEACDFIRLFIGDAPQEMLSYKDAFLRHTGINPFDVEVDELDAFIEGKGHKMTFDTKDDRLTYILATWIEPHLTQDTLTIIPYFPPTQAALAKVQKLGPDHVAERFEVFYKGLELANGYHELTDAQEQRKRLIEANEQRVLLGKEALPIDERFLQALEKGIPDACGVAVGFDRLVMLHCKRQHISDVLAWDFNQG